MAETKASREKAAATDEQADALEAQDVSQGIATSEEAATSRMKAYQSDRNLAEVNANTTIWLDPDSEDGARLLATGWLTEVDDPA